MNGGHLVALQGASASRRQGKFPPEGAGETMAKPRPINVTGS